MKPLILLLAAVLILQTPTFAVGGDPPRVHDPSSILPYHGEYWLFCTGSGVRSWHSRDLVNWSPGPSVFQTPPLWVTEVAPKQKGYFWAPELLNLDKRYLLYYAVSQWGQKTSAIALATNTTLDPADLLYHWADQGIVLRSTAQDNFNAIDPSLLLDPATGRLWMAFGSFWSGIKLVELDPATGLRKPETSIRSLAWAPEIEAPYLAAHGSHYYLFVNWGRCCHGIQSTYEIRVGRSASITGPYLDRKGVDMMAGGGSLFLGTEGRFIGPGQTALLREGQSETLSYHFYDGDHGGASSLGLRKLHWSQDGWPIAGEQLPDAKRNDAR